MRTGEAGGPPGSGHAPAAVGSGFRHAGPGTGAVILVEGHSDRRAVEALARRIGRDLSTEGVSVVPMGGATNIGHYLEHFGPHGLDLRLAGVCDAGEAGHFVRALERAGIGGPGLTVAGMEALGFHVCVDDLEDELIRALGAARVVAVVEAEGELGSFRIMQRQPAQRQRTVEQQLRRFLGSRSGRKSRYAQLLVDALDPSDVPLPLRRVLGNI